MSIVKDELYKKFDSQVSHDVYNDDIMNWYTNAISKPLLTREEEIELFKLSRDGDTKARQILIERNLLLVVYVAKRYIGRGMEFIDLIEEGNIGLIRAVDNYDLNNGAKFSTYALTCIERTIRREFENKARNVRIPNAKYLKLYEYINTRNELATILCTEPSMEEIANYMNISLDEVYKLEFLKNDIAVNLSSLQFNEEEDYSDPLVFLYEPSYDQSIDNSKELSEEVATKIKDIFVKANLNPNEMFVLECRFGINNAKCYTLEELSKKLNLSRQRICQIVEKGLNKLKLCSEIDQFAVYLDDPDGAMKRISEFRDTKKKAKKL